MKRYLKPRSKRQLSPEKLQRREAIFALYRDMGPGRTYERLIEMVRSDYGPVSRRSLVNWSREHNWRARIDEHDRRLSTSSQAHFDGLDPDFDMVEALERIARTAIHRVLLSNVEVRTPQDAKVMIEAAEKASKLAAEQRVAKGSDPAEVERRGNLASRMLAELRAATAAKFAAQGTPVPRHAAPGEGAGNQPDDTGTTRH